MLSISGMYLLMGYYDLHVDMPPHHKINTSGILSPISSFSIQSPGQKGISLHGRGIQDTSYYYK